VRYVDLRGRRYVTGPQEPAGPYTGSSYPLLALGFVLGLVVSFVILTGGPVPATMLLLVIVVFTLVGYLVRLLTGRRPRGPKTGGEKQLLMAIVDAGGSLTPVEAALRTSLSVDEAEQLLTRFADRGHLVVHSRDGVLLYAMPGR
jgi:hypothetical protein